MFTPSPVCGVPFRWLVGWLVNGEFIKNLEGRGLGLVEVVPRD